jgi:DNA-binding CsgD family transcriptional regulator
MATEYDEYDPTQRNLEYNPTQRYFRVKSRAVVPDWAKDDGKVKRVVIFKLQEQIKDHSFTPATREECLKLEARFLETYRKSRCAGHQRYTATVERFGGPLAFLTSVVYRRYRLGMGHRDLAEHYDLPVAHTTYTLHRLNKAAGRLFGPPRKLRLHLDGARVLELNRQGLSIRAIARELNVDRGTVQLFLKRQGEVMKWGKPPVDRAEILALTRAGLSPRAIETKLGISRGRVRRVLGLKP